MSIIVCVCGSAVGWAEKLLEVCAFFRDMHVFEDFR